MRSLSCGKHRSIGRGGVRGAGQTQTCPRGGRGAMVPAATGQRRAGWPRRRDVRTAPPRLRPGGGRIARLLPVGREGVLSHSGASVGQAGPRRFPPGETPAPRHLGPLAWPGVQGLPRRLPATRTTVVEAARRPRCGHTRASPTPPFAALDACQCLVHRE